MARCWHCTFPFPGNEYSIPVAKNPIGKFVFNGSFCSLSCSKAYLQDNYPDDPVVSGYFFQYCNDQYGAHGIRPAPPFHILQEYQRWEGNKANAEKSEVPLRRRQGSLTSSGGAGTSSAVLRSGISIAEYRSLLSHGPDFEQTRLVGNSQVSAIALPIVEQEYLDQIFLKSTTLDACPTTLEKVAGSKSATTSLSVLTTCEEGNESKHVKKTRKRKVTSSSAAKNKPKRGKTGTSSKVGSLQKAKATGLAKGVAVV